MDFVERYHQLTNWIVEYAGTSDKFVHLNAGLAIFLLVQLFIRDRRASYFALALLLVIELFNEIFDALYFDDIRWSDTLTDIGSTMFWPTAIVLVGKYRRARWNVFMRRDALKNAVSPKVPPLRGEGGAGDAFKAA